MSKRKYPEDPFELVKKIEKTSKTPKYVLELLGKSIKQNTSCLGVNVANLSDPIDRSKAHDFAQVSIIEFMCAKNLPLIHTACIGGNVDVVSTLLKNGVSINSKAFNEHYGVMVGPLLYAILFGHEELVSFMVNNGANIHEVICGRSIAHYAAVEKNSKIIKTLEDAYAAEKGFETIDFNEKPLNILADASILRQKLPVHTLHANETLDENHSTPSISGNKDLGGLTKLYFPTTPSNSILQNPAATNLNQPAPAKKS